MTVVYIKGGGEMVTRSELVDYINTLLNISAFDDYAPNGLQVEGSNQISKIIGGVTASQALIDAALEQKADAILVHHGFFWKGEDVRVVGMKHRRLKSLLMADMNMLAYHLPLDAHHQLGNNAQLARLLKIDVQGSFGGAGTGATALAMHGCLRKPIAGAVFHQQLTAALQRTPLHIAVNDKPLQHIAWCTGAAQSYFEAAVALGVDAFITGEISEQTTHIARESGVDFFAAGHHATERYGVLALGKDLADHFGLDFSFIDIDNPV